MALCSIAAAMDVSFTLGKVSDEFDNDTLELLQPVCNIILVSNAIIPIVTFRFILILRNYITTLSK